MFTAFHLAFNERFEKLAMAEVREDVGPDTDIVPREIRVPAVHISEKNDNY